jgi:putative cardiolipin synthase
VPWFLCRYRRHTGVLPLAGAILLAGCSTLPPGSDYPKVVSVALPHPEETRLGQQFDTAAREHDGDSGFRIITVGVDGFLTRMQLIGAAEKTLDLQYYIFRGDETGRMLSGALLRAADRGVRVRVLVDDGDTMPGDEQIAALTAHPSVEVRIFNPFRYRGHRDAIRNSEWMFNSSRLDYRMHNKLLVADNAVALIGGRNIGNQYFQMDPESQLADDDVFVAGPVAQQLSGTFDEYWNSAFAIPAAAFGHSESERAESDDSLERARAPARQQLQTLQTDGIDYAKLVTTGEPYAGMISGRLPLVWAHAQVICDSPDKKNVERGALNGRLMTRRVAAAVAAVQTELLMVTPYFIPADEDLQRLNELRQRNVRVRILTNSLESSNEVAAESGYLHYRVALVEDGVELYEIRSLLGNTKGSGQTRVVSRYGNYSLHAKLFVFDRKKLFIGSMNYDQRSKRLNTEIGLIIDSPELAQQTALRFDAMVRPQNSYALALRPNGSGKGSHLVWQTEEDGTEIEYAQEPARSTWQRIKLKLLSLLPIRREL